MNEVKQTKVTKLFLNETVKNILIAFIDFVENYQVWLSRDFSIRICPFFIVDCIKKL